MVPRTVSRGVVPRGPHAGSAEGVLRMRFAISKPKFGLCWYGCECFLLCLSL